MRRLPTSPLLVVVAVFGLVATGCLTSTDRDMRAGHAALRDADWPKAIARYRSAAERFRSDPAPSERYALALYYQADAMLTEPMAESAAEAEQLLREALAIWDQAVGPRRLSTLAFLSRIAQARKDQHDAAGADKLYRLSDQIAAEHLPPDHRLMRSRASGLRFELAGHPDEIERYIQP